MDELQITMVDLHKDLDTLIERAAQGDERVVLLKDGKPAVVIIGVDAWQRLEAQTRLRPPSAQWDRALAQADALRQRIEQWRHAQGIVVEDTVACLHQIREEHDASITGLR